MKELMAELLRELRLVQKALQRLEKAASKPRPDPSKFVNSLLKLAIHETRPGRCFACDLPLPKPRPGQSGRKRIMCHSRECLAEYHRLYRADRAGGAKQLILRSERAVSRRLDGTRR